MLLPLVHRPAALAPLTVPTYRTYLTGQAMANTGQWAQSITQDWLVFSLTHDPGAVGLVMAAQFGPMLVFGLHGGSLADRFDRRRLLIVTGSLNVLLTVVLALVCLLGHVTAWQVGLLALLSGMVAAVDNPTRQSFVNEVVPQHHLRGAVALTAAVFQASRLVGPAIAALMLDTVGPGWAFVVAAVLALGPVVAMLLTRPADLVASPPAPPRAGVLRQALHHVAARPQVAWTIVLVGVVGTFGLNFPIVLSAMAEHSFTGPLASSTGADRYGLFNLVLAVGSIVGALIAAGRTEVRLRVLVVLTACFGLAQALAALAPDLVSFAVLIAVMGTANLALQALANASVQLWCEPAFRGRVMGLYLLVFLGGTPIGAPLVGAITAAQGARVGMLVCGVVPAVAAAAVAVILATSLARARARSAQLGTA